MNRDKLIEVMARGILMSEQRWIGIDPGSPLFCRKAAQAALEALEQAGFRIVPEEPTEAMLEAGFENSPSVWTAAITPEDRVEIYRAMIAAAKGE